MANTLQIKRGVVANIGTLAAAEPFFSTDENKAYVGDGSSNHGITMDGETDISSKSWFLDEDDMTSDDATKVASQQSIKAYVDASVVGLYDHKGSYDASTNSPNLDSTPSAGTIHKGDAYTVSVAGDFYTEAVNVGDVLIADTDDPASLSDWTRVNKNIDSATTTTEGIVELATDGESSANKVVQGNDSRLSDARTPTSHSSTHVAGGGDELDGDTLHVTWTGYSNYTPATTPAEVSSTTELTAHLYGIDQALTDIGTTWIGLDDTPADYTGYGTYVTRVNSAANAIEFVDFTSTYLESTPSNGETAKAPNSDWAYDHNTATTGDNDKMQHAPNGETLLHTASTIDCGTV